MLYFSGLQKVGHNWVIEQQPPLGSAVIRTAPQVLDVLAHDKFSMNNSC